MKAQKNAKYGAMDIILENQDASEIDTMSAHTKTASIPSKNDKKTKKSDNGPRKIVISKLSKYTKDSSKKSSTKVTKIKNKKTKKRANAENANHSINMNIIDSSIIKENYINKSYQDDYYQEGLFKSASTDRDKKHPKIPDENINSEIEYAPKPDHQSSPTKDWENIEMFSSKKFSDILKKHKKVIRYHDSEVNEEESYIDAQYKDQLNITDFDDSHDFAQPKPLDHDNFVNHKLEKFDRIKKVEPANRGFEYTGELKIEELTSSIKRS
jgi:hypothetical protein